MSVARNPQGSRLVRQWSLLRALQNKKRGVTPTLLVDKLNTSRATLYRDLEVLQEAGFPIVSEQLNGEARWTLLPYTLPSITLSPEQTCALLLAQDSLAPLAGTRAYKAIDEVLGPVRANLKGARSLILRKKKLQSPDAINAVVEKAIVQGKLTRILYRSSTADTPAPRLIAPVEMFLNGDQLYVNAWDENARHFKTFKIARISAIDVLTTKSDAKQRFDSAAFHAHSVGVWSGEPIDVEIRIAHEVARFIDEWPLCEGQEKVNTPKGVVVKATVAGSMEVLRWVLRWGRNAEVLGPLGLRRKVADEVKAALLKYGE